MPYYKALDICQIEGLLTEAYYEKNASRYFESTLEVDMSALYDRFLRDLPQGGRILDAGNGSGRDTLAFLKRGYSVEAFDASTKLAKFSSYLAGIETRVMRFQDLAEVEKYDGIWACAALLHVCENQLPTVVSRFSRALRMDGGIYMSFKLGSSERIGEDGRLFTDMDEPRLSRLIKCEPLLHLEEIWISRGEDVFRGQDTWVNAIAVKQ